MTTGQLSCYRTGQITNSQQAVIGTIDTLNYWQYGVFRNNDFRSADFQSAYGALSRIKHDQWQRYVVFPKDARERAYRFSPAVRELQPSLEGPLAEFWRSAGCTQTGITPCPEILSGWFMWALRDAVAQAGHYRSATEARLYYLRLAAEINGGCEQHPEECLPPRQTMLPPWRQHYLLDTAFASWRVLGTLLTMGGAAVGAGASWGPPEQLALFSLLTNNGPLAAAETTSGDSGHAARNIVSWRDDVRYKLAQILASAEGTITAFCLPAALVAWLCWLVIAVRRRRLDAGLIIASSLIAAVGARVLLLGFLEATSIPSNNMLYLFPVAPMALALIPTVLFGVIART